MKHYMKTQTVLLLSLLVGSVWISGCSLFKKKKAPQTVVTAPVETRRSVELTIKADATLNGGNRVRVVIYQLQRKELFMASSRQAFWLKKETLLPDIAGDPNQTLSFEIDPNVSKNHKVFLYENTKYIGVAVDFFRPDGNLWRTVTEINPNKNSMFQVSVQGSAVSIK
ncbi:MAG TPA: type VI secretion system lipoprotein TssJ [Rhodothermales bacterium]|nr:type VI secretion system lipoprotein TssJ [Rhodothermales bacterium]